MSIPYATAAGDEERTSGTVSGLVRREFLTYAIASVLCVSALVLYFQLWKADLRIPISYSHEARDAFFHGFMIKTLVDAGWILHNPLVGAPDGLEFYDYPVPDNLHLLPIKLIALVTADYGTTFNLYYYLQFLLTTWASLFVFRQFGISASLAVAGSVLYAFLPYHFWRWHGHLYLADYAVIPLVVMVVLWVCDGEPLFWAGEGRARLRWRWSGPKAALSVVTCILLSGCGAYYAFFGAFLAMVACVVAFAHTRCAPRVLDGLCLVALISASFLAQMTPFLWYARVHGKNPEVVARDADESLSLGLSLTHLVVPAEGHRVPALPTLSNKNARHENPFNSLGLFGACGFLALITVLFFDGRLPRGIELLSPLSKLNIAAILLAVPYGFSLIFAKLISPQIRAYNRISIYIAFFALFAVVLIAEFIRRRWAQTPRAHALFSLCLGAGLVVGLLDQTQPFRVPDYAEPSQAFAADAAFVRQIEGAFTDRAMVFQLPYLSFPENGPIHKMADYSHFMPYFHSKTLRWSYGAMRGRATDQWQRQVASLPAREMVSALVRTGFAAIYVDRSGYLDGGAKLEAELSRILPGEPIVSADRRFCVYRLQPAATVKK